MQIEQKTRSWGGRRIDKTHTFLYDLGLTQNRPALLSCLAVQRVLSSSGRLAGKILRKSYELIV